VQAAAFLFLTLILGRPERYGASCRFDTMPSSSLHACANAVAAVGFNMFAEGVAGIGSPQ
jgi:hypothetical protein